MADEVYAIERVTELAESAAAHLGAEGYDNVHILNADGTRGWAEQTPFDAILVSASAPVVPESLKDQVAVGGRVVIPIGADQRIQELIRITRCADGTFETEDLADVRFVALIGEQGWEVDDSGRQATSPRLIHTTPSVSQTLPSLILRNSESFEVPVEASFASLMDRIGDARVVLIGEASHGTSEFYQVIEHFWSQKSNQKVRTWRDHLDINRVMLVTSLVPDEFLRVTKIPMA